MGLIVPVKNSIARLPDARNLSARFAGNPAQMADYIAKIQGLFGSSLIGFYPGAERSDAVALDYSGRGFNGAYTGVTLGQPGIGDDLTCPLYDGVGDFMQPPAGFRAAFNGDAGTFGIAVKMFNSSIWTDGLAHYFVSLLADGNNFYTLSKETNNMIRFRIKCNVLFNSNQYAQTSIDWMFLAMTWFWDGVFTTLKPYMNGVPQTTIAVADRFVGALAADTVIGASSSMPALVHNGWAAHAYGLNRAATPAEVAAAAMI
jgi:hypothetical protein